MKKHYWESIRLILRKLIELFIAQNTHTKNEKFTPTGSTVQF